MTPASPGPRGTSRGSLHALEARQEAHARHPWRTDAQATKARAGGGQPSARTQGPARVLMTADSLGGVWTCSLELARALGQQGIEVALATMGGALAPFQRQQAHAIPTLQLFESQYRLEWMEDPWRDVEAAGEWLLRLEDMVQPDVVHLNCYAFGALPWRAPVLVVGHSCVLSWWQAVKGTPAPPSWSAYREAVARGLRGADMVVAPSAAMLSELERLFGPLLATRVVPNGRDRALFAAASKEPLVLTVGRLWDEGKNVLALESVARHLSWPVYAAGECTHPQGGTISARHIRLLGPLPPEHLARWYARASVYALPARYEPFGLSVVEAALSGCALVLGDIPSLRELWEDAAIFVSPDDTQALCSAIQELAEDEALRGLLATGAYRRALEYNPQRMAAEYVAVYRELAFSGRD